MQIARNYLSPTIRRVSLLARIMPLPVALSPRSPVPLFLRYRTSVPHGDDLVFRFFVEAYRHLLFSRIAKQGEADGTTRTIHCIPWSISFPLFFSQYNDNRFQAIVPVLELDSFQKRGYRDTAISHVVGDEIRDLDLFCYIASQTRAILQAV